MLVFHALLTILYGYVYAYTFCIFTMTQQSHNNVLSSYSYSNLPKIHSNNTTTSNDKDSQKDCWVLVFGYHTDAQRVELLGQHFRCSDSSASEKDSHGGNGAVREIRRCGPNATALRFESPLHAAKATCRTQIMLRDGTVCGVQALSHRDPRLVQTFADRPLFAAHTNSATISTNTTADALAVGPKRLISVQDYSDPQQEQPSLSAAILTEDDILLLPRPRQRTAAASAASPFSNQPNRSICERFLRWMLEISDQDS